LNEEIGLPHWESINYEFDLMIQNPDITKDIWGRIGANTLIIHPKSFKDESGIFDFINDMSSYMIDTVLAVTYDEYFVYEDMILDFLKRGIIKSLQIMTIKTIGSQGQKFDERCVALIEKIKNENPDTFIRVDGGMNDKVIVKLAELSVDEFIIGSAIFSEGNARENLNYFQDLC
jgi:pentose-5-phosphate-3-epimerase